MHLLLESTHYYILIRNFRTTDHQSDNLHIEKIFSKSQALKILQEEERECYYQDNPEYLQPKISDLVVVTDDLELLFRYISAINADELKLLCNLEDYYKCEIRINKDVVGCYQKGTHLFTYFTKILNNEIVSANMSWETSELKPFDNNSYVEYCNSYEGWVENQSFLYFETPSRYKINQSDKEVFSYECLKYASLEKLNSVFNCNLLKIGCDDDNSKNWEYRNGLLRYFDPTSKKRIYFKEQILNEAKERIEDGLIFKIKTKLDYNFYIEYYIEDIDKSEEDKITNTYEENHNDWKRDTFNAMTDGQLGDYNDFDGSFDDIDIWSRG